MSQPPKKARAETDFVQWHSDLERIFTSFSCETRNPIQSIWGALSVIQRRADPGDESLTRAVGIIKEETGQLHELVQEYLEFVRPVEGKQIAAVDLNALLVRTLTIVQHNHGGTGPPPPVVVTTSLDPSLPHPQVDYEEVKRAFLHIIKKSYGTLMEKGGTLAMATRHSPTPVPGRIFVTLTAEGPGIKREYFDQISPRSPVPFRGKGLGVAIGRRIIEEHCQGNLKTERIAGEGLRLLVSLPVKGGQCRDKISQDFAR